MVIQNTFWTRFDNTFYRVKNNELLQAPLNSDESVDTTNEIKVVSISSDILKLINTEFGSHFNSNELYSIT